jgi:hypothetical protein
MVRAVRKDMKIVINKGVIKMNLPEIETIEDMDTQMSISQWDLINVAEKFQRKGFYFGVFTGLGLVGLFALLRNVI